MNFAQVRGFFGAAFLMAAFASGAGAQSYVVTDLGTLGTNTSNASFGYGLNDAGTYVGSSNVNGSASTSAFSFSNGVISNLGTLGVGGSSEAFGVNNSGVAVGDSFTQGTIAHAFAYNSSGLNDLGTLGGNRSYAEAINSAGIAVGYSEFVAGSTLDHAFTYDTKKLGTATPDTMHDIGTLGGNFSYAYGVNDSGVIVGASNPTGSSSVHAYTYKQGDPNGGFTDISTLGGVNANSFARGVNSSGVTVGYSDTLNSGQTQAFVYTPGGSIQAIGTLGAKTISSRAYAINNIGDIVGNTSAPNGPTTLNTAFLYTGGNMVTLNSLAPTSNWNFQFAYGINNNGTIIGYGLNPKGATHAFALTRATPVPSSLLLAVFGAGGIGLAVRRKRRSMA